MSDVQKWPVYLQPVSKSIAPLSNGPGGPYDGGMEARIAKLESHVEHIQSDVTDVKAVLVRLSDAVAQLSITVARIDAKLDSKVDHKWLTVSVLGIVAVILRSEIAGPLPVNAPPIQGHPPAHPWPLCRGGVDSRQGGL